MIQLIYDKKTYLIPENWNELSRTQVVLLIKLMHEEREDIDFLYHALQILLDCWDWEYVRLDNDFKARAFDHIIWIAGENTLTKNPFPVLCDFFYMHKLYGPADEFDNIRAKEFHHAEMNYIQFIETKDVQYLNNLVGILYRKHCGLKGSALKARGDVREDFNEYLVKDYAKYASKININTKRAIFQWYDGCRQNMLGAYNEMKTGKKVGIEDFKGLYPLMHSMAGDKYGQFEVIEQKLVWDLLYAMKQYNDDAKEQQKELAKKK